VNKDVNIKVTKQCKVKFSISAYFIDEVELDVVPLDVCSVVFGSPYMSMVDVIFMQRENQYHLIKDGKYFIINAHKVKSNISPVSANQAKKLISTSKKYVFLFLRENHPKEELIVVHAFVEEFTKEKKKQQLEFFEVYKEYSKILKGFHLRGKWSMRYSYSLNPHYQILGSIDSLFLK
jgi:hypothetical protein